MSPLVGVILFIVFVASFGPLTKWYIRRRKFVAIIDKIPGPKAYPLIGTGYLVFGHTRETIPGMRDKINKQYPYILRQWFGPMGLIYIKKAEHIEKAISSGKAHLEKAFIYDFFRPWFGDGLLVSHGDKWHSRRKMITPAFHFSILERFCEIMVEKSQVLVQKLQPNAASGEAFQMYPYITRCALDIIVEAAMGTVVNAQDEADHKYATTVYNTTELLLNRIISPWKHIDFIYKRTKDGQKLTDNFNSLHGFTNEVIAKRKQIRNDVSADISSQDTEKRRRPAFLDILLDVNEKSEDLLTNEDLRGEVDTFMFGGHDTTAVGISWALYLLGRHPEIQENVFDELQSIFRGSDRAPTIADLSQMHLLGRVIKETLRIYPSIPIIGRIASDDIQLDEQYMVPKGCHFLVDILRLHQDERFFPDPERFDPDRFLPENMIGRHPYAYIPFSAGSRNCIGQKFGVYEEKIMLSTIVRSYRFRAVGKDEFPLPEVIVKPLHGVWMVIENRK